MEEEQNPQSKAVVTPCSADKSKVAKDYVPPSTSTRTTMERILLRQELGTSKPDNKK